MRTKTIAASCLALLVMSNLAVAGNDRAWFQGRVTRSFTEPIERSIVASSEAGVVNQMLVREGDRVKAGDIIGKIDHDVLLQSLRFAEARAASTAAIDAARARMNVLQAQKTAIQSLVPGGHVNKYELEQKVTEYETALAEFRKAEEEQTLNKIEAARIRAQLERRYIKSPIDGFVTEIHKQLGEHVSSTEPQFATIVRIDELRVRFFLDEETLDKLQVGDRVEVEVGRNRQRIQAIVSFVSPVINSDSGTARVDVHIANAKRAIRSGTVCYWMHGATVIRTEQQVNRVPEPLRIGRVGQKTKTRN